VDIHHPDNADPTGPALKAMAKGASSGWQVATGPEGSAARTPDVRSVHHEAGWTLEGV
jgi:hypothetical protein